VFAGKDGRGKYEAGAFPWAEIALSKDGPCAPRGAVEEMGRRGAVLKLDSVRVVEQMGLGGQVPRKLEFLPLRRAEAAALQAAIAAFVSMAALAMHERSFRGRGEGDSSRLWHDGSSFSGDLEWWLPDINRISASALLS
jgi:hypothetical protein